MRYRLAPISLILLIGTSVASPQDTKAPEVPLHEPAAGVIVRTNKPVIGLMTTLPIAGRQGEPPWVFFSELKGWLEVKRVPMDTESIDDDIEALMVVHSKEIKDTTQYAIDQFVMRGGRLIACLDPVCLATLPGRDSNSRIPRLASSSNLERLLRAWGFTFEMTKVAADMNLARKLVTGTNKAEIVPTILLLTETNLNKEDAVFSRINEVWLPFPGVFTGRPVSGLKQTVLFKTTKNSQLVDGFLAQMSPSKIVGDFKASDTNYTLAMRLEGKFKTAFPEGKPGAKAYDEKRKRSLSETKNDNTVVLIGDADWLSDRYSVRKEDSSGQNTIRYLNGNVALAQNLVAQAAGIPNASAFVTPARSMNALEATEKLLSALMEQHKYDAAMPIAKQLLDAREKEFGTNSSRILESLQVLAALQMLKGDQPEALPLLERGLRITEKALGPEHTNTARSLEFVGVVHRDMRQYSNALAHLQRALKIREKAQGPEHPDTAQTLHNLAILYKNMGEYSKALPLNERALAIREKALGPEHKHTVTTLNNLASLYDDLGQPSKASPLYERALRIREERSGSEHPDTANSLNNLALLYQSQRDYSKAKPLLERALRIWEKAHGPEHPTTAKGLNNLAGLHKDMGDYAKALPLFERALKIRETSLSREHPDTAQTLSNLGNLYSTMGQHSNALPLLERALTIAEKALGSEQPQTGTTLMNLASLHSTIGDYAKAQPLYERALMISEKVFGPEHETTASTLNSLAGLYAAAGDFAKARPLIERALEITEKTFGPENTRTARSLNKVATCYVGMGDYSKAQLFSERALTIMEKVPGPEHPDMAESLRNLGLVYEMMGDYSKAEAFFGRALTIAEKALGPEETAMSLNNLARLYHIIGDYAKAQPLCERALQILEKALGPEHPLTAFSLIHLALLHHKIGDYAKALPLCERALRISEKALGTEHPQTAGSLIVLASLHQKIGDHAKARPLYERALKITEERLGLGHPLTSVCLNNLAELYREMGDYAKALPLFERALKIREKALGSEHPMTATCLYNLAMLYCAQGNYSEAEPLGERAVKITEKFMGSDHPDLAVRLKNSALIQFNSGKQREALASLRESEKAQSHGLANILSFASEQQRLNYQSQLASPYALWPNLGRTLELAQAVFRYKGVVLDSIVEDQLLQHRTTNAALSALIDRARLAKQRLLKLALEVPKDFGEPALQQRLTEKGKLGEEVEQLERELIRQVAGFGQARRALTVTVEQVQGTLPGHSALVEFIHYPHFLEKTAFEERFGAIVLTRGEEPKWVPLGAADVIDQGVRRYHEAVRKKTEEATVDRVLKELWRQVWEPVQAALPKDTRTVILSPDGQLNFVSFATLVAPEERFLGEKYFISYVASGRDLLRETKPSPTHQMMVFGNPDFSGKGIVVSNGSSVPLVAMRSLDRRDLQSLFLIPLPGTSNECVSLAGRAKQWDWPVKIYLGTEATEAQLQAIRSPRILHLATHGFFLPETDVAGADFIGSGRGVGGFGSLSGPSLLSDSDSPFNRPVVLKNPMHRSGLALAGAQTTLATWGRGETPPMDNDGIVTAEEVGGLKLGETWLVVLSACETGAGEARSGEGVLGLRRGFIQAGAQNLLMTLWSVSDEETARIMLNFYEAVHKTGNAPQALAEVQRDWLVKLRKERGLAEAVRIAGPFIVSSQGRPQ